MAGRDFRAELAAAAQRADVGELLAIAYQLLGRVEQLDERRAHDAERKRRSRDRRVSVTSGMSQDVTSGHVTSCDVTPVVPPLRTRTNPPPTAAARVVAKLGDERLQRGLSMLREKFTEEQWEDVASFFLRRKYDRWTEWAAAMLREVGPGSQYEPIDLVRVCQDDGTLDKRLGSAGILRSFLQTARQERVGGNRSPPSGAARPGSTSRRDTNRKPVGVPAPPTDSIDDVKWQT